MDVNKAFDWMHMNCDVCIHEEHRDCNCPYARQWLEKEDLEAPCDKFEGVED